MVKLKCVTMPSELQRWNQEDKEVNGVQPARNSSDINLSRNVTSLITESIAKPYISRFVDISR